MMGPWPKEVFLFFFKQASKLLKQRQQLPENKNLINVFFALAGWGNAAQNQWNQGIFTLIF